MAASAISTMHYCPQLAKIVWPRLSVPWLMVPLHRCRLCRPDSSSAAFKTEQVEPARVCTVASVGYDWSHDVWRNTFGRGNGQSFVCLVECLCLLAIVDRVSLSFWCTNDSKRHGGYFPGRCSVSVHVPQAEDDMGAYTRKINSSYCSLSHSPSGSNSLLSIYSPSAGDIESNVQNVFTRGGEGGRERERSPLQWNAGGDVCQCSSFSQGGAWGLIYTGAVVIWWLFPGCQGVHVSENQDYPGCGREAHL